MPALQVRDFPEELYVRLKESAAAHHRSIAQQVISIVESSLSEADATTHAPGTSPDTLNPNAARAILEASLLASNANPYAWLCNEYDEPDAARKARRDKRAALREQATALRKAWTGSLPTCNDIARTIRATRDERTEALLENAPAASLRTDA